MRDVGKKLAIGLGGLATLGAGAYGINKLYKAHKERKAHEGYTEVPEAKYYTSKKLLERPDVVEHLKKNPRHGLIVRRHDYKGDTYHKTYYRDLDKHRDIEMDNPLKLKSKKMNDELTERYGPASMIFIEKTFY